LYYDCNPKIVSTNLLINALYVKASNNGAKVKLICRLAQDTVIILTSKMQFLPITNYI